MNHFLDLNVEALRELSKRIDARIAELLPIEKVNSLKTGSIITLEKNGRIKNMQSGGAFGWDHWFDFEFIGVDADRESYMVVRGPIGKKNIKSRTVSIPMASLRAIRKRA